MGIFSSKKSKIKAVVPQMRESLRQDRLLLLAAIVGVIKKHWHVLEDKFEQYTDEDDYGNLSLQSGLKQEFIYFGDKVVLPELEQRIDNSETVNKDVTFILSDTIRLVDDMPDNITLQDTDEDIARKLQVVIDNDSLLEDENLYTLSADAGAMSYYVDQINTLYMATESITLRFQDQLRTSQPVAVTPFVALIFKLFSIMHNNKSSITPKEYPVTKNFIGNDPYKYEEFIKNLLRSAGFTAKRTKSSGDFGVDVVASKNGKTFAIQCKLYNRPVGTKAIQEIVSGRLFYKADFGVVVSDNSFTDAAKVLARRSGVVLTHHNRLILKLKNLAPDDVELSELTTDQVKREPVTTRQWTQEDADELITVILPTITNDK